MIKDLGISIGERRKVRAVLAAEGAECGLACLVMIARYHGRGLDLNSARQRFSISLSGGNLRDLMALGDQLGFASRALRVEIGALSRVQLPAILHWDLDHFVVLSAMNSGHAVIFDPARGKRQLSIGELSNHYTGVALELTPVREFKNEPAAPSIRLSSLWTRIQGFWLGTTQLILLSLALQIATLAAPFQMQLVVDEALAGGDIDILTVIALGFGALLVIQALLDAVRGWTLQAMGFLMSYQMVGNLVHHLLRLSATFFERRHVGDILSRLGSASAIQSFFTQGIVSVLIDGAMALISIGILFVYSPQLTFVVLVSLVVMLAAALAYYPVMRARLEERLVASAKEQSFLIESVRAATTIKVMGREAERESDWRNLYSNVINASLASGQLGITYSFIQALVGGVQSIIVVWLGARTILEGGGLSVGMLIAFLAYRQTFTTRIGSLISQLIQFRLLNLHLERLADIVTSDADPISDSPMLFVARGGISFRHVSFRYGASDALVLDRINLDIQPSEFVAITGPSGCGKTTLLKLLLGLQSPTSGDILLDGISASKGNWRGWRANVGVVAQDDRLLSGTIADNICFFDPDMTMEKIVAAAQAARIHEEIIQKPMQYRTLVGDMGSSLSGGQRQRILLARALYRNPSILVLDEGTANLDEATEQRLVDLIAELPITRIVVTHRPALARRAGRVLTLGPRGLQVVSSKVEVEGAL